MGEITMARRFGKYRIIARLGGGGMADVFLAQMAGPSGFSKLAVVKRLRAKLQNDDYMLSMFLDEGRLAARLNHQNVVNTYEVGQDKEGHFIAMEFLEGQPLSHILAKLKDERLPLEMHLHILCETLTALQYAHDLPDYDGKPLGIVHRDVSPQNIFVTYSGQSKLVDFGVAKAASASSETRAGVIKGKVTYMAPEQAVGKDSIDGRADIFAVGILFWEAITRKRFWDGLSEISVLAELVAGRTEKLISRIDASLPELADTICKKALAYDPNDRYATASDMQTDIEALMQEMKLHATSKKVGEFISLRFGIQRKKVKDAIESFIKSAAATSESHVTAVKVPELRASLDGSQSGSGSYPGGGSGAGPMSQSAPSSWSDKSGSMTEPRKSKAILIVGLIGSIALVAAGIVLGGRGDTKESPPVAPVATQVATAVPTTVEPVQVTVEISAPAGAAIFLDGREVSNPYRATIPRDTSAHSIRAEAKGFVPRSYERVFDRNTAFEIALDPVPKGQTVYITNNSGGGAAKKGKEEAPPASPAVQPGAEMGMKLPPKPKATVSIDKNIDL